MMRCYGLERGRGWVRMREMGSFRCCWVIGRRSGVWEAEGADEARGVSTLLEEVDVQVHNLLCDVSLLFLCPDPRQALEESTRLRSWTLQKSYRDVVDGPALVLAHGCSA